MGRVAGMVMVLAAAGQARGGGAPTAAERALAAVARERLLEAAELLARPRELFPREAVRALVEDLGLARGRDPSAMGYRPRRASIAERILLTKRKVCPHKPLSHSSSSSRSLCEYMFRLDVRTYKRGIWNNLEEIPVFGW